MTYVESKKKLKKMPSIVFEEKSVLEKIEKIIQDDKLLEQFIFYSYQINYPSWYEGEEHTDTWCNHSCSLAKFISLIKEFFDSNFLMNIKKTFFKFACLKEQELFMILYNEYFW